MTVRLLHIAAAEERLSPAPRVSVVICTYNRCSDLAAALDAVLRQDGAPPYEVLLVDNNSTDGTRALVSALLPEHPHLRYLFEPVQGLPVARNTGIRAAGAPIIAFTDDDILVGRDWVASVARAFEQHPEADIIGGRVIPRWPATGLPAWFTPQQLAPLAVQDKGEQPVILSRENAAPCLIGANFSFRRSAFEKAGLFDPEFTRSQDREIQLRLWKNGGVGLYVPDVVTYVDVPADRLTRSYYRHWYSRAGRFHSRMRLLEVIDGAGRMIDPPGRADCVLGLPPNLYRQLLAAVGGTLWGYLRRDAVDGFYQENRVRYLWSYMRERWHREGVDVSGMMRGLSRVVRRRGSRQADADAASSLGLCK